MKKILLLISFFVFGLGFGQNLNPADRDPSFNQVDLPLNNFFIDAVEVIKLEVLPDNKILILAVYEMTTSLLIKMDNNVIDQSFFCTFSNIKDFIVQPDGNIILLYTTFGSSGSGIYEKDTLVRINSNGSVDDTFIIGAGTFFNNNTKSTINSVCVQADGKIVASGKFNSFNGIGLINLFRLNSNGTVDTGFDSTAIQNIKPLKTAIQQDQKILVFNSTTNSNNNNNDCILYRLNIDGTIDTSFISTVGFSFSEQRTSAMTINDVDVQSNGKIIVCGNFGKYEGSDSQGIVRINYDGSLDTTFSVGNGFLSNSVNQPKYQIAISAVIDVNGKIIVGGDFVNYSGNQINDMVRLNSDGTYDSSFIAFVGSQNIYESGQPYVLHVTLDNDGKIFCNGTFNIFNGKTVSKIVKLNENGSIDSSYFNRCKGFDSDVTFTLQQPDQKVLAFGKFKSFNGVTRDQIVRLNTDGNIDFSFSVGPDIECLESEIYDAVLQPDGKIIVAKPNDLKRINGYETSGRLIRFNSDGTKDLTFNSVLTGSNKISLAIQSDGKLLVAGILSTYNNVAVNGELIRLNIDGSLDATYNIISSDYYITKLVLQPDGKILLNITDNNFTDQRVIRLLNNFQLDTSFLLDSSITKIKSIKLQADGKILGVNQTSSKMFRLNSNGTLDTTFNFPFNLNIYATNHSLETLSDLKILFSSDNGKVYRLNYNGSLDASFDVGNGFNSTYNPYLLSSIKQQTDGKILVAGSFKKYRGLEERSLLRLSGEKFNILQGKTIHDFDENGCDSNDLLYPNLNIIISNGDTPINYFSDASGNFFVPVPDGITTLTPSFENTNYFSFTPASITLDLPTPSSPFILNFCVVPNGNHPDLEIIILPLDPARPGFISRYKILYKNKGNKLLSGTIEFMFDNVVSQFINSYPFPNSQIQSVLNWDFIDLYPFQYGEIYVNLQLNSVQDASPLNSGDIISCSAYINSLIGEDDTTQDNTFLLNETVVNSFDPNDKTCLEGATISTEKVGDYVHYMIRFENTGTYAAQNITVKDVIDISRYDISSLIPLNGSHQYITRVLDGNKVEFYFENIYLPFDDTSNDGYIVFKIKIKSTLVAGDSFSNSAAIYFDYNYPITTNSAITTITALSNQDFTFDDYFTLFPNPVESNLNIAKNSIIEISSITIYNTLGQIVIVIPNPRDVHIIDISNLKSGNYFVKINSDKGTATTKFVKM